MSQVLEIAYTSPLACTPRVCAPRGQCRAATQGPKGRRLPCRARPRPKYRAERGPLCRMRAGLSRGVADAGLCKHDRYKHNMGRGSEVGWQTEPFLFREAADR